MSEQQKNEKDPQQPKVFGKPEGVSGTAASRPGEQGQSRAGAKMAVAMLKLFCGILAGIVGLVVTLLSSGIATAVVAGLLYLGMVLLFISGGKTFAAGRLLKSYQFVLEGHKSYDLEKLAGVMQKPVSAVYKELKILSKKGFLENIWFAPDGSCVFFDLSLYEEYTKNAAPAPDKDTAADALSGESSRYIAEMADIRSRVENAAMAEKIRKLEETTGKILGYVKEHPERRQETGKFLRYYLPTTLKLLHTYDEMDAQNVDGKTISGSMEKIESSMDSINASFERLLDGLFQSSAMDVSAEISVLQSMLSQEGLSGKDGTLIMDVPASDSIGTEIPDLHL